MTRYLYDPAELPKGFRFPESFLTFVDQVTHPDLHPWQFFFTSKKDADGWLLAVKRLYPDRKLVPIAHWMNSDDIACFDGSGLSDDPEVYFVHAYASPGWEHRGQAANFSEWLVEAAEQSAAWKKENAE